MLIVVDGRLSTPANGACPRATAGNLPKAKRPQKAARLRLSRRKLSERFTVTVDSDGSAGGCVHLYATYDAPEVVGDVPVFWAGGVLDIGAPLNILTVYLSSAATHICPYRRASHSATGSGDVPAASASDLMPENAADDCPNDRPGDIGPVASLFNDLLALDPATLLRRSDHRAHRCDGGFV